MSETINQQDTVETLLPSALIKAVEKGNENEVKRLLDAGIAVDETDSRGMNALFQAVSCCNLTLVKLLVEGKAFVNARDIYGRTPLFYAIIKSKQIAKYLIKKGADVNFKDFSNRSALSFLVENCMMNEDIPLSSLISAKKDELQMLTDPVRHDIKTILGIVFCKLPLMCVYQNSKMWTKPTTEKTRQVNQETIEKTWKNFIPALREASTYFAEKDTKKKTMLDDFLEDYGGKKSFSAMCGDVVKLLVKTGADPNFVDSDGNTALHYAAFLPFLGVSTEVIMSMLRQLEKYGLRLNARNHLGQTPLLFCLSGSMERLGKEDKVTAMKALVEVCKFLVTRGSSLEETTKGGESVFHLVIKLFQQGLEILEQTIRQDVIDETTNILRLFSCDRLNKGTTVNKRDSYLNSPLHIWATLTLPQHADHSVSDVLGVILEAILEHLLKLGAALNPRNEDEETPLHMCKTWSAFKLLIDSGANPNDLDSSGRLPILAAMNNKTSLMTTDVHQFSNESVIRLLSDALFYAVQNNNESVARDLIDAGADVNSTDNEEKTALFYSVIEENEKMVETLLKCGATINAIDNGGKTALFYAVRDKDETVVRALLDAGADVSIFDNEGKTALFHAVQQSNNEGVVRALINASADVSITDNEGKTPLFHAVQQNNNENVVLALINAGADVNVTDNNGETALFYALTIWNNESVVRASIDAGANVNVADKEGKTALFYTVQESINESVACALIEAGADANMKNLEGQTVLFKVAGNLPIARMLIEDRKSLVNARDVYGRTPLFYAMIESLETASLLIDKGAKVTIRDNCNVSILAFYIEHCLATAHGMSKGLDLLREKGIAPKAIFETILSVVFCSNFKLRLSTRFGEYEMETVSGALETAKCYIENKDPRQKIINEILTTMNRYKHENAIHKNVVSKILAPLVELGADPSTADSEGNTALHYATRLIFENVPLETVKDLIWSLIEVDASFNTKNHQGESPILFCLSERFLHDVTKENTKWDLVFTQVYGMLIENGSSVDDIEKNGNSLFHLILILFQRVLYFGMTLNERNKVLGEVADLFQLCCQVDTTAHVTINKRDSRLNSPLHLWSNLKWIAFSLEEDWQHLRKILNCLLNCGARLNERNKNDETPLHLCTTWRATKLLLGEGANPNDLDSSGRTPLLSAALRFKERIKGNNPNLESFYEDASLSPRAFWKDVLQANLDPWIADKHGQTVLGVLIESEAFALAKTLLEAARETKLLESDTIAASVLNAICKDRSTRALWKPNLFEIILRASKNPRRLLYLLCNGETPLHCCCRNIIDAFKDVSQASKNDNPSSLVEEDAVENEASSVHWTIAKQLLLYGADCTIPDASNQSCLDIAEAYPALKKLLSTPIDMDEVFILIPWRSVSKRYQPTLAKVARQQECKISKQYRYHQNHLARGAFGFVFAGINKKDGREVAIKQIKKQLFRPEDKRQIRSLIVLADCKQVVRYLSLFEDAEFCYVVSELMEGNLDEYLDSPWFDITESIKLCEDIVKGLNFLHSYGILHRDLKPSNILYKWYPKLCLKIADFGVSDRTSVYGTNARGWIAPEVLKSTKEQHSAASDMFSCGLVLHYFLSTKKHPFSPKDCVSKSEFQICNETEINVIHGNKEGWDISLSHEAINLIEQLLESHVRKRPTAAESMSHPLFWSKKKKLSLLIAVGSQPEFECPRAKRTPSLTAVETDLEASIGTMVKYVDWNDPGYVHMPAIYTQMTKKRKRYNTHSVVELVRFIRNSYVNVSESTRPKPIRKLLLEDFVFLEYFPNLVMEVYKAVTTHGWDQKRDEIKYAMKK